LLAIELLPIPLRQNKGAIRGWALVIASALFCLFVCLFCFVVRFLRECPSSRENLTFSLLRQRKSKQKERRLFSKGSAAKKVARRWRRTALLNWVALAILPILC
jgi:hypothetical protein